MKKTCLLLAPVLAVALTMSGRLLAQGQGHEAFGGIWKLNTDRSDRAPTEDVGPESRGGGSGSGGFPGGAPGGGFPGGGGRGRGGGFPGGSFPSGSDGDRAQQQATMTFMRSLLQPSERLTIVVKDETFGITDADGKRVTLETTNKKVSSREQNGLVKLTRRTRWDGASLVSEIELEGGMKIRRRYELAEEGTQLRIATTMDGGVGGRARGGGNDGKRTMTHVYERFVLP
jgi:hypothetical protein